MFCCHSGRAQHSFCLFNQLCCPWSLPLADHLAKPVSVFAMFCSCVGPRQHFFLSDSLYRSWILLWVDPFLAKPVCSVLFPCWSRKSLFHSRCYSWSLLWAMPSWQKLQCSVPLLILDNSRCSLPSATSEVCSEQTPKTCLQCSVPLLILDNSLCMFPSLWSLLWADAFLAKPVTSRAVFFTLHQFCYTYSLLLIL